MPYSKEHAIEWVFKMHIVMSCVYLLGAIMSLVVSTNPRCDNTIALQLVKRNATSTLTTSPFNVGLIFFLALALSALFAMVTAISSSAHLARNCRTVYWEAMITTPLILVGVVVGIGNITDVWAVVAVASVATANVMVFVNNEIKLNFDLAIVVVLDVCTAAFIAETLDPSTLANMIMVLVAVVVMVPLLLGCARARTFVNDTDAKLRRIASTSSASLFFKFACALMWSTSCASMYNPKLLVVTVAITWVVCAAVYVLMLSTMPDAAMSVKASRMELLPDIDDDGDNGDDDDNPAEDPYAHNLHTSVAAIPDTGAGKLVNV